MSSDGVPLSGTAVGGTAVAVGGGAGVLVGTAVAGTAVAVGATVAAAAAPPPVSPPQPNGPAPNSRKPMSIVWPATTGTKGTAAVDPSSNVATMVYWPGVKNSWKTPALSECTRFSVPLCTPTPTWASGVSVPFTHRAVTPLTTPSPSGVFGGTLWACATPSDP